MSSEKIDDYLTLMQAAAAIGTSNRRSIYRAIERAERAGHVVTAVVLGRRVVPKSAVPILKEHYFPYYSEQHQKMVKQWGSRGGTAKARNREKATRQTPEQS